MYIFRERNIQDLSITITDKHTENLHVLIKFFKYQVILLAFCQS